MKRLCLGIASFIAATAVSAVAAPSQMTEKEMGEVVAGSYYTVGETYSFTLHTNKGQNYALKTGGNLGRGWSVAYGSGSCTAGSDCTLTDSRDNTSVTFTWTTDSLDPLRGTWSR